MKIKLKNILLLSGICTITFLLNACSTTRFTEKWSEPNYPGPALNKILIIGVIKNDNNRRAFEKEFSSLITTANRTGIASYTLLPDLEKANKETVLDAVKTTGADGVMIVTTHGLGTQGRVTADTIELVPSPGAQDYGYGYGTGYGYGMYGYYNVSHAIIYKQGYSVTDSILRIDTKLFNAATEKMIWSGKTKSINPTSARDVIHELQKLVIRDMGQKGMIK